MAVNKSSLEVSTREVKLFTRTCLAPTKFSPGDIISFDFAERRVTVNRKGESLIITHGKQRGLKYKSGALEHREEIMGLITFFFGGFGAHFKQLPSDDARIMQVEVV